LVNPSPTHWSSHEPLGRALSFRFGMGICRRKKGVGADFPARSTTRDVVSIAARKKPSEPSPSR